MPTTTSISNWGNYPKLEAIVNSFKSIKELKYLLKTNNNFIARGNGRCYGDSSLHSHILSTTKYNNILAFDSTKGLITCQAGVSFDELIHFLVPKGFFLPVTPGTKFITVGGAVASDIHGKNHHQDGSFGRHIVVMDVLIAAGEVVTCSNQINSELFNATCGGMGLTGIILQVTFSLKRISSYEIDQVSIKAHNLEEVFKLFEEYKNATYSVAWIDCLQSGESLGRSILMVGEHSDNIQRNKFRSERKFSIPFNFPSWVLNKWSIKIFNFLFYHKLIKKKVRSRVSLDQFFYPLDFIGRWNKMYGKNGFVQYQFVLPLVQSKEGLKKILTAIGNSGSGSFLAVLKLFGEQDSGLISFPMKGYTLALDFPMRKGLFEFLDKLDALVLEHGGRIYLTKDARMKKEIFWDSYQRAKEFEKVVLHYNPNLNFRSSQSDRLAITKL